MKSSQTCDVSIELISFLPGGTCDNHRTWQRRCAPSKGNLVFEWSKPFKSAHDLTLWQASHPCGVPRRGVRAMRSLNSP